MHRRIPLLIAAVAALCLAIAVPTASAASKTDKAQTKALKKQAKAIKKQSRSIKKGSTDVTALKNSARAVNGAIDALKVVADRADKNGKAFESAAPAVIQGLTDLKTGLLAAGAGLTGLKTLATSTEYGVAQVSVGGTPIGGGFVVTPDIPDAVQQAQASGSFNAGANTGAITIAVAVRSAESDGDGNVAAAHCRVTGTDQAGRIVTSIPNAGLGGAPFYPINTKSAQTSTDQANAGFPFGPKTTGADADNLVNLTNVGTNAAEPLGATNVAAGSNVLVQLSCVDTTPSATDPSA